MDSKSLIHYQLRLDLHARNRAPSPQNSGLNKIQVVIMLVGASMTALQGYQGLISFHLIFYYGRCYSPHSHLIVQTSCWDARHHIWSLRCKREEEGEEWHVFSLSRHPLGSCTQFCWNFICQNLVMRLQLTTKRVQGVQFFRHVAKCRTEKVCFSK